MSGKIIATNLRLPEELHRDIKKLADKDDRSMHSYIILTLKKHVESVKN